MSIDMYNLESFMFEPNSLVCDRGGTIVARLEGTRPIPKCASSILTPHLFDENQLLYFYTKLRSSVMVRIKYFGKRPLIRHVVGSKLGMW